MNIKMTQDFPVAPKGWDTELWAKDSEHENIDDQLGEDLILAGVAAEVPPSKPAKGHKPE